MEVSRFSVDTSVDTVISYIAGSSSVQGCVPETCLINWHIARTLDWTYLAIMCVIILYIAMPEKGSRLFIWKKVL